MGQLQLRLSSGFGGVATGASRPVFLGIYPLLLEKPSQETVENFRIPDNGFRKYDVTVYINTTGDQR
jgi:hypothetical protein